MQGWNPIGIARRRVGAPHRGYKNQKLGVWVSGQEIGLIEST